MADIYQGYDFGSSGGHEIITVELTGVLVNGKPDFNEVKAIETISTLNVSEASPIFDIGFRHHSWRPNTNSQPDTIITWLQNKAQNTGTSNYKWDLDLKHCQEINSLKEVLPRIVWGEPIGGIGVGLPSLSNKIINLSFLQLALANSLSFIIEAGWNKTSIIGVTIEYEENSITEPIILIQEQRVS